MAEEFERLLVRVEANAAQFEAQMRKINRALYGSAAETRKSLDSIQDGVDQAAGGMTRSAMMATAALSALGVGFGASQLIADFREAEESAKRLEAVLTTTGHAAGLSSGQVMSWARELEEATGRSATEIQNAAAQLATFTSVGRNEFLKAIEVANDMAAVFGGDLTSNLDAVARALDDPIEGFANLRKRGFALSDAELKRAEAHLKAGRSAEAQQVVLENLSGQVNGTAAAVNTGLTKALNDLNRQAGDTFKELADQGGTDAAVAALELASKGVMFLGENMDDLLKAAEFLAVFMATRYVAGMTASAVATGAQALAAIRARGAVDALSAAMARNPAGLAAIAVAALVAGTWMLVRAQSDAAITAKAQANAHAAAQPVATELDKLVRKLASANDEETASIRRKIAALIQEQEVKARIARDAYDRARREEVTRTDVRGEVSSNPVFAYGPMPAGGLQFPSISGGRDREGKPVESAMVRTLAAEADAMDVEVGRLKDIVTEADELRQNTTPLEFDSKPDKGAAQRAQQRARAIEDMAAEINLQEAQLRNDQDRVRELEREAAVRQRTRALVDAEILKGSAAAAEAERVQKRLDDALGVQTGRQFEAIQKTHGLELDRVNENLGLVRQLEQQAELQERIESYQAAGLTLIKATEAATADIAEMEIARASAASRRLADAREEHRLTVAELSGQRDLARQLADQQEVRNRAKTYEGDDYRLSGPDAERRATDEVSRERLAATRGEHREMFATAFSEGIRAAMDGDIAGFLAGQVGGFVDTMLQRAGEQLYDSIFGTVDAVSEGTAQGAAVSATVTPAIVGAGATAAASMGAAITAAGATAAATMAAAISSAQAVATAARIVPGFDSGGYTGPGGKHQPAGVVHKGEVVWSQQDIARAGGVGVVEAMRRGLKGYDGGGVVSVIPQVNAAMNRAQQARGRQSQPVIVQLSVEEGAMFAPRVQAISGQVAVQATGMGVAYTQDQMQHAQKRRRQSLVG